MTNSATNFSLISPVSAIELKALWPNLEARCGNSYFLSWGWVQSWLETLPPNAEPMLLRAQSGEKVTGLAVLFQSRQRRHGFVRSRSLHLNETGRTDLDCLTIEYNGMLAPPDETTGLLPAALSYLDRNLPDWDEFYAGGMVDERATPEHVENLHCRLIDTKPAPYVSLDKLAAGDVQFRKSLSQNTRQQLNRAIRQYEARGSLQLEQADTLPQALAFFGEMKELHQRYWTGRGKPGSFANPYFELFHRHLIENRLAYGEIQLLRLRSDDMTIGVLYNFVYRGTVYAYQSGFKYESDNRMKPGLVMHCLAIEYNIVQGARRYDFLAGDGQHKRSLSNAAATMNWLCYQRPRLSLRLENMLRAVKNGLPQGQTATPENRS